MILTVQILGIFFALDMIFLTYYFYKRGVFESQDSMLWTVIWVGLIMAVTFPQKLEAVAQPLQLVRVFDFLTVGAFFLAFSLLFVTYSRIKSTEHHVKKIVRELALVEAEKEE